VVRLYFLPARFSTQAKGKLKVVKKALEKGNRAIAGGQKEGLSAKIEESPVLSGFLNEVRTFFEGEEG